MIGAFYHCASQKTTFPKHSLLLRLAIRRESKKPRVGTTRQHPGLTLRRCIALGPRGNVMQSNAAAIAAPISERDHAQHPQPVPAWIDMLDRAVIVLLNVALVAEVILVFVN